MTQHIGVELLPRLALLAFMSSRARVKSRIASCSSSGTHTAVRSPLRSACDSLLASRRSVLIRSPGLFGISDGATT